MATLRTWEITSTTTSTGRRTRPPWRPGTTSRRGATGRPSSGSPCVPGSPSSIWDLEPEAWPRRFNTRSGKPARWSSSTAATELLSIARRLIERPGYHVVAVHADLERQPLDAVLEHRPVDLIHAGAVVHHLDDELAAIRDLAAVVRPGGQVAIGEGGLGHRFLPADCGIGEPGLEQRLAAAQEAWFWDHVRPTAGTVRTGRGGTSCWPTPAWST